MMYFEADKHELWWHRKRLYYIISFLSEIFEKSEIATFADAGCAEGLYVKHIATAYRETFCIGGDVARAYVEKAKSNKESLRIEYIVCDIESLPFKDSSIDVVLCSEVLEHVPNYRQALRELHRVMNRHLIISIPGHTCLYKIISPLKPVRKFFESLVLEVGHISEVKVSEIQEIFHGAFRSIRTEIGGALPLQVLKAIPSIGLVEAIDNTLSALLKHLGIVDCATIHVLAIQK
jgi:SAM-dependent methyltransferase